MSLASRARSEVDRYPFLRRGLQAGVINYTAAARFLDIDGDIDAVATALRRYANELDDPRFSDRTVAIRMQSGVDLRTETDDRLLVVDDVGVESDGGPYTAISVSGAIEIDRYRRALAILDAEGIETVASGISDETMVVITPNQQAARAVDVIEAVMQTGRGPGDRLA